MPTNDNRHPHDGQDPRYDQRFNPDSRRDDPYKGWSEPNNPRRYRGDDYSVDRRDYRDGYRDDDCSPHRGYPDDDTQIIDTRNTRAAGTGYGYNDPHRP